MLSQLPSEFWASSISMEKEGFTVDQKGHRVGILVNKSKKGASLMDKTQAVATSNVRKKLGQKIKSGGSEGVRSCFNCFEAGRFKPDYPTKAADRDPNRPGGPIFRTDVYTAPGGKKAKMTKPTSINTIKAVVKEGKQHRNEDGETQLERCAADVVMGDIESLDPAHHEGFADNSNTAQIPPQNMEGIEDETEPGFKEAYSILAGIPSHTIPRNTQKGSIKLHVLNPRGNLSLTDISYGRECDSNVLSAYYLAKQGYDTLRKDLGLLFAAIANGEGYYLPSVNPIKANVVSTQSTKYGDILNGGI
ncbi:LOW QUALITY PROTEIN: Hypothetical protein PHPALM_192 [Phytophthora palmivora]|uniref:Uncharacterized protein n=1 Tax=Phytophthora palmivora TaxID=4796 RepID=A0A2P4YVG7_9STRA|nr:LOW QUALITY PROTEIN: Hypothetical protein PHPALM_192 [Phytophthora palmivora]